jgi:DNA-directed RNA polymerase subunit H (RpoH/RPB5)
VTFFLDNTNPPRFATALRAFDYDVHHLIEISDFPKRGETLDSEWIPYVAARRWATITGDHRILTKPDERRLLEESKLVTIFLPKGYTKDRLWAQFQLLIKAWEEIVAVAERAKPGDCYEVQRYGKVTFFVPPKK